MCVHAHARRRHIPSALRRKIQGTRQAALRLQQQGQHGLLSSYQKGGLGGSSGGGDGVGFAGFAPLQPIATTAEVVRDRGVEVRVFFGVLFFLGGGAWVGVGLEWRPFFGRVFFCFFGGHLTCTPLSRVPVQFIVSALEGPRPPKPQALLPTAQLPSPLPFAAASAAGSDPFAEGSRDPRLTVAVRGLSGGVATVGRRSTDMCTHIHTHVHAQ